MHAYSGALHCLEWSDNLTYNQSMKAAQAKYRKKIKQISLKFYPSENIEYERIKKYTEMNDISYGDYIKSLIKADLDAKGIPYPELSDNIE